MDYKMFSNRQTHCIKQSSSSVLNL